MAIRTAHRDLLVRIGALLAADSVSLAGEMGARCIVQPLNADLSGDPLIALADVLDARCETSGLGPISAADVAPTAFPISSSIGRRILLPEPAGGWTWVQGSIHDPPEQFVSYAIMSDGADHVWQIVALPSPIPLTTNGQAISIGSVDLIVTPSALG